MPGAKKVSVMFGSVLDLGGHWPIRPDLTFFPDTRNRLVPRVCANQQQCERHRYIEAHRNSANGALLVPLDGACRRGMNLNLLARGYLLS